MKTIKKKLNGMAAGAIPLLFAAAALSSCTDLDEKMYSDLESGAGGGGADAAGLLISAYDAQNGQHQAGDRWRLSELSTDEAIIPTRGGDWDDGGTHRAIHLHIWNADNPYMTNAFESLNTIQFRADNVLAAPSATAQQKAEARFIRALAMYDVLNLWGFIVQRKDLQDVWENPTVIETKEAIDLIQQELETLIADLPEFDGTKAYTASKHAARFLLMKLHLNKAVFLNREDPTFAKADMDKVLELAKAIKDDPRGLVLSVGGKEYFDNFAPHNDQASKENIYTLVNNSGSRGGMTSVWKQTVHPNMHPSGWNGAATLKAFYESFNAGDVRRGMAYNGYLGQGAWVNPQNAVNVGFLVGQQYNLRDGTPLVVRNPLDAPMVFVPEVKIQMDGATIETAGVRVVKYAFDHESEANNQGGNNDWAVFRYADLLLMEAEAILRGGTPGTPQDALDLVNSVRAARNAGAPFATLTEDNLLAERGRELYWEGWRREDLIRFGKFLEPNEVRKEKSAPHRLLYPVPTSQMAVNPNLKQNTGY